jgi:hypothetical protein
MARLTFPTSPRRLPGLVDDYLAGKLTVDDYVTHRVRAALLIPLSARGSR